MARRAPSRWCSVRHVHADLPSAFLHTVSASYTGTLLFGASQNTANHQVTPPTRPSRSLPTHPIRRSPARSSPSASRCSSPPRCWRPDRNGRRSPVPTHRLQHRHRVGTTCTLTFTSPGRRSLTATYSGDADFNGSTSTAEPHLVNNAPPVANAQSVITPFQVPINITLTEAMPMATA